METRRDYVAVLRAAYEHCVRNVLVRAEPVPKLKHYPARHIHDELLRAMAFKLYGRAGLGAANATFVRWAVGGPSYTVGGGRSRRIAARLRAKTNTATWPHEIGHMLHIALWPHRSTTVPLHRAEAVAIFTELRAARLSLVPWRKVHRRFNRTYLTPPYDRASAIACDVDRVYGCTRADENLRLARRIFFGEYG